jgi:diguanylate cyclase (GGDEF)-like protein/PAS domain S-box-containing protein
MLQKEEDFSKIVVRANEIFLQNIDEPGVLIEKLLETITIDFNLRLIWLGIIKNDDILFSKPYGPSSEYIKQDTEYKKKMLQTSLNVIKEKKPLIVNNLLLDKNYEYIYENAKKYNLRSAAVFPILPNNKISGILSIYSDEIGFFTTRKIEILSNLASTFGVVLSIIENMKEKFLLEDVLNRSIQGIVITDSNNKIIYINPAFTKITGYTNDEAIGQNPSILKSSLHSKEFYSDMWERLKKDGFFSGRIYNKRKDGTIYPEIISISTIKDKDGNIIYYTSFFIDISDLEDKNRKIEYLMFHDSKTGLLNTKGFYDKVNELAVNKNNFIVVYIDLDNFAYLNTAHGIEKGDLLLRDFGHFLENDACDKEDYVCYFGSDEFAIISLKNTSEEATKYIKELDKKIKKKEFTINSNKVHLSGCLGISLFPIDSDEIDSIISFAQASCIKAKQIGKGQCAFYSESIQKDFEKKIYFSSEIIRAIERFEFELFYQPIFETNSKNIKSTEALIRWRHNEKGILPPYAFIPFAEESDLIEKIDYYVIEKSLNDLKIFQNHNLDISISANITGRTFLSDNFLENFKNIFYKKNINPNHFRFEITESIALSNIERTKIIMDNLAEMGIYFNMDDFGTGYSSLSYLNRFDFKNIKIDSSFVFNCEEDPKLATLVSSIIHMLNNLQYNITAEGVENEFLFFAFNQLNCNFLQGYFLSKPIPLNDFISFVKNFRLDDTLLNFLRKSKKTIDFELIKAKYEIYRFIKTIEKVIQEKGYDENLFFLKDYKNCAFGKWSYSNVGKYANSKIFKEIVTNHIALHKITEKLINELRDENILYKNFENLKKRAYKLNNLVDSLEIENLFLPPHKL